MFKVGDKVVSPGGYDAEVITVEYQGDSVEILYEDGSRGFWQTHQLVPVEKPQVNDPVTHPAHYNRFTIEVLDFIRQFEVYNYASAVKYISRAGHKDPLKEVEDIEKAIFQLQHELPFAQERVNNAKANLGESEK